MHERIYFNRQVLAAEYAAHSALSSAALYGKGVFSTIAIYEGVPFLWEKHFRRFRDNAKKLGIDLSEFTEDSTRRSLDEIIERNGVINGRARITFFDESPSEVWPFESERKTSLLITTADRRLVPESFKVGISTNRVSSFSKLSAIKSCNYLDKILAYEEAKHNGFDEAIRLNERREVTSGCMANVFWLKDGRLFTPSLKTGCLPGTTREFILENVESEEVEETDIHRADSIFLTSAGLGVVQVAELEGKKLLVADHPILHLVPGT